MANSILACRACWRRAFQLPVAARVPRQVGRPLEPRSPFPHRSYASAAPEERPGVRSESEIHKAITDAPQTLDLSDEVDPDNTLAAERRRQDLEKKVKSRLMHIDDPYHVAASVHMLLRLDRYDEALLLTERASRTMQTTTAWNALIKHQLENHKIRPAIKLFNDMKKRAIFPNVHTYTIIFDGLAKSDDPQRAMPVAVKHYEILMNDPRLSPNTTHFNAVLNVCARAHDLDQMFLIAASLNDTTRQPDPTTYTTILHALRHKMLLDSEGMPQADIPDHQQAVVDKAKGLWEEIDHKWRKGRLDLDEKTVCAMGRILVHDKSTMSPNTFPTSPLCDLLEKTMGIPNYAKNPGANAHAAAADARASKGKHVAPTQRTLSLVLEFAAAKNRSNIAIKYWNKLVNDFGVVPDPDNYFRMLLVLKRARAGSQILNVLRMRGAQHLHAGHFIVALETCVFDNINPHAVRNATDILRLARQTLPLADPALPGLYRLYLRVALVSHHGFRATAKKGDEARAREAYGRQILGACLELWEPCKDVQRYWLAGGHAHVQDSGKGRRRKSSKLPDDEIYTRKRDTVALLKHLYSALNKLTFEDMLPKPALDQVRPMAAKANRDIQAFYAEAAPPATPRQTSARRQPKEAAAAMDGEEAELAKNRQLDAKLAELEAGSSVEGSDFDSGMKRLGAEYVWNTRAPMGPAKGSRNPAPPRDSLSARDSVPGGASSSRGRQPRGASSRGASSRRDGSRPSNRGRRADRGDERRSRSSF